MAQAISHVMANLVVLERHLWLNLTEIKDADKTVFLDSPWFCVMLYCSPEFVTSYAPLLTEAVQLCCFKSPEVMSTQQPIKPVSTSA